MLVHLMPGAYHKRPTDEECLHIEGAFRLLPNRLLHGPITALTEETHSGAGGHTLLDAGCVNSFW